MAARHLQLIDALDARSAEIHEAFLSVWGSNPDQIKVQHRDALIRLGVTPEAARRESNLRKLRKLREA